ncbi:MAG: hypothetical protein JWN30_890 [Bacilli bacterium]|nr:hypothetical protein [Bacilli bacterium]
MIKAIDWVGQFPKYNGGSEGIKPGLERMEAILTALGSPHQSLSFIHVAGTNGKGSTCAFLSSIFAAAGLKIGLYTSPFLETFHDRMRVGGRCVTDEQLDHYVQRLKPIVDKLSEIEAMQPTEFELVTALGLLFFAEEQPDIVIWETGLGGRLDATNVVTPLVSVITNIGLDHQHILGASESLIAKEKAGIIKTGVPVVSGATGEAIQVIQTDAAGKSADISVLGVDFTAEVTALSITEHRMRYDSSTLHFGELDVGLLGAHQAQNAALAIRAAEVVARIRPEFAVSSAGIRRGISSASWPGRFEVIADHPIVILDGAHNPDGVQALTSAIKTLLPGKHIRVVMGILQDKVIPDVINPIARLARQVIVTQPNTPRAAQSGKVEQILKELGVPSVSITPVSDAVLYALENSSEEEVVLVTGSLFTISEARAWWKRWIAEGR